MTKVVKRHRGAKKAGSSAPSARPPAFKPRNLVVVATIAKAGAGAGRHGGESKRSRRAERRAAKLALRRGGEG